MQKEALYQKYRSQTFDELVGQQYVVRSIKNAVQEERLVMHIFSVALEELGRLQWLDF